MNSRRQRRVNTAWNLKTMFADAPVAKALFHQDPTGHEALVRKLGGGDRSVVEFEMTPTADLDFISSITEHSHPLNGRACAGRNGGIQVGTTSMSGDWRHELGHLIWFELEKDPSIAAVVTGACKAYQAGKKMVGKSGREFHTVHEFFAEHYRAYHKAIYQNKLNWYAQTFPEMAQLWNAFYAAA